MGKVIISTHNSGITLISYRPAPDQRSGPTT
jgi:hypothetical protein